jgi:hypothetical protein
MIDIEMPSIAPPDLELPAIFVRFTKPGFHHWPEARGIRAYLAARHRHLFHVDVGMSVRHADREVEFHDLRDYAASLYDAIGGPSADFGARSCERIAEELGQRLADMYERPAQVTFGRIGSRVLGCCAILPGKAKGWPLALGRCGRAPSPKIRGASLAPLFQS